MHEDLVLVSNVPCNKISNLQSLSVSHIRMNAKYSKFELIPPEYQQQWPKIKFVTNTWVSLVWWRWWYSSIHTVFLYHLKQMNVNVWFSEVWFKCSKATATTTNTIEFDFDSNVIDLQKKTHVKIKYTWNSRQTLYESECTGKIISICLLFWNIRCKRIVCYGFTETKVKVK